MYNQYSDDDYYINMNTNKSTDEKIEPLIKYYTDKMEGIAKLQMEQKLVLREISYVLNSSQNNVLAPSLYDCAFNIWSHNFEKNSKNDLYKQLNLLIKYAFPNAYKKAEGKIKVDKNDSIIVQGYDAYKIQIPLLYKTTPFKLYVAKLHQYNGDNAVDNINDIYKCTHIIMYDTSSCSSSIYGKGKFDLSDLDDIMCKLIDDINNKKINIYKAKKNK